MYDAEGPTREEPTRITPIPTAADQTTFMQKMRMLSGYQVAHALRFAVDLDLATILVDGPCTIEDLAAFTEADRTVLERNVRRLESVGVFRMHGSTVEITELGASLARESGAAPESADVSEPGLDLELELEPEPNPERAATSVPEQLTASQDATDPAETTQVADSISTGSISTGPVPTDTVPTDTVPTDDALVLSSVLNDWTYEDFNRILGTLGAATPPGGRLLLIELVLPPDGVVPRVGDTDPLTVSALGGRGHTEAEWTSVLAACGFRLERIRPGVPPFSFLDAIRQ